MLIKNLKDLLECSSGLAFGSSSDDGLKDSERMERMEEAASHGGDGSTHAEVIQDLRDMLSWCEVISESVAESIVREIDDCEQWHIDNGSIDDMIG